MMFAILPLLAFLGLFEFALRRNQDWRYAFLVGATLWALYLIVLTELLSLFNLISRLALTLGWLLFVIFLFVWIQPRFEFLQGSYSNFIKTWKDGKGYFRIVIVLSLLIGLVGVTAIISPPNGWDQMQYHMPRVFQWSVQHSIAFFPTHYYVQLFSPPLAEWIMLHFYILFGSDRLVNLVQWFAYFGSVLGVTLVAKHLGADRRGQILAAVFCATFPPGILGASGAKNDWVLTFWLVALVVFMLQAREDTSWLNTIAIGGAMGTAVLTKGSSYAFVPPIFAALIFLLKPPRRLHFLRRLPAVFLLAFLLNFPQWTRNYGFAGSPLGLPAPDVAQLMNYGVDRLSVGSIAADVVKKTSLNFALPRERLSEEITRLSRGLINLLGQDPDDASTNLYTNKIFKIPPLKPDEYWAGSPIHVTFIVVMCVVMLWDRKRSSTGAVVCLAGVLAAYLVFCAIFRWEPSGARLQVPLLAVASAAVSVEFVRRFPRLTIPAAVIMLIAAMPFAIYNNSRPMISRSWFGLKEAPITSIFTESRQKLYFAEYEYMAGPYISAANAVRRKGCNNIGLDTADENLMLESADYPLFALISPHINGPTIRYSGVENLSSKYARDIDGRQRCVVLCVRCRNDARRLNLYASSLPAEESYGDLIVFSSQPAISH
jgi:4-amino-4-deoxy-L-arabinose transferase-like glycosyltransferase